MQYSGQFQSDFFLFFFNLIIASQWQVTNISYKSPPPFIICLSYLRIYSQAIVTKGKTIQSHKTVEVLTEFAHR